MLLLCASVDNFRLLYVCVLGYVRCSTRELGERHASCDILLSLLLQLRLRRPLRVFLRTAAAAAASAAAAAAAAVCCFDC